MHPPGTLDLVQGGPSRPCGTAPRAQRRSERSRPNPARTEADCRTSPRVTWYVDTMLCAKLVSSFGISLTRTCGDLLTLERSEIARAAEQPRADMTDQER